MQKNATDWCGEAFDGCHGCHGGEHILVVMADQMCTAIILQHTVRACKGLSGLGMRSSAAQECAKD